MTRGSFCTWSMSPSAITRPSCKHGDTLGDGTDEIHVMLDHHHGVLALERLEKLSGALDLLRGHAGDRLVDQQQLRLLHQQHADLKPLLLAVGEHSSQHVLLVREADDFENVVILPCCASVVRANSVFRKDLSPANASSRFSNTVSRSNTVGF